jgi:hypothetical protein
MSTRFVSLLNQQTTTTTRKEVVGCPQAASWKAAMLEGMASVRSRSSWEPALPLPHIKACPASGPGCGKIKRGASGNMERFKAGSDSKGFKQTQGVDYIAIGHSEQNASPRSCVPQCLPMIWKCSRHKSKTAFLSRRRRRRNVNAKAKNILRWATSSDN